MRATIAIAQKEFKDGLRNRWLIAISLIFAIMACGLSWFGSASVGSIGFSSIANTIVSLSSLNVFLLPLIALLLSYNAIVGEDEDGTLLLLLTYPLSKGELLLGKLLGHTAILAFATSIGFGSACAVIGFFTEDIILAELIAAFALFIISAILLGMIFICLSYVVSSWVAEKSKAAGLALVIWFFFVLIFDMTLLGILVLTEGKIQADLFPYLLLLNPTDIFRLVNLSLFETNGTGLLSIATEQSFSLSFLLFSMMSWVVLPFCLAYYRFKKRPL